jgi:drug/metabolite transporter (DMT)-like permease
MGLAALVFLPLLRPGGLGRGRRWQLAGIGAVQYGLMYMLYIAAFARLQAWEVALFTLFTPLYVTLLDDLAARRLDLRHQAAALLAVGGAAVIHYREPALAAALAGFLLVQGANLCFAFGQVAYRRLLAGEEEVQDHRIFGLLFLGALAVTLPPAALGALARPPLLGPGQALVLLYLGLFAAGLCFFLWNHGARLVDAGTLAVCNNLKVPGGGRLPPPLRRDRLPPPPVGRFDPDPGRPPPRPSLKESCRGMRQPGGGVCHRASSPRRGCRRIPQDPALPLR